MGEDDRRVEGRRVSPRLEADVEHALPDHDRSRPRVTLRPEFGIGVGFAGEHPIVKPIDALVGSCDESVERHREIEVDPGHRHLLSESFCPL
jgi:hypothetical protein